MNRYRYLLTLFALFIVAGCGSTPAQRETIPISERSFATRPEEDKISIEELDQLIYGFADRYFMTIGSAVDAIKEHNPNPVQRRIAHGFKQNGTMSIFDIASGYDPYSKVLDLVVAVTLQSILVIDENNAEKFVGDRAPVLIKAMSQMREEVWDLAARVLTQEQLETLDYLILEWRRTHRNVGQVAFVKFDNFAGARAATLITELKSGSGLLAPISEVNQELIEYRRLAERTFWYSKRVGTLAAIQIEAATSEIFAAPEVVNLARTIEELPEIIETQRKAVFKEIDIRQEKINDVIANTRELVSDIDKLGHTVQTILEKSGETMQIADNIAGRYYDSKTPSKPFDINEYAPVVDKLNEIVAGLNGAMRNMDHVMRSAGWQQGLSDISNFADRRIDRIFRNVYIVMGLLFVGAVGYRILSGRLGRKT